MKKTVLICTLLMAILFSFTAVLADDTQVLIDMIRTEVASTVIAEIRQTRCGNKFGVQNARDDFAPVLQLHDVIYNIPAFIHGQDP